MATTNKNMMINKSFAAADVSHCNTSYTVIYEDDNVILIRNKYGAYIEWVKQSLEDIIRDDPDECSEEAIEVLRNRGLNNIVI